MIKRRVVIIGRGKAGKSELAKLLNDDDRPVIKTQDIIYGEKTVDVPGAYLESPGKYSHIIATVQNSGSHVLILSDSTNRNEQLPPGFAKVFNCPVIGVITKCDEKDNDIESSKKRLKETGACEPYFQVSSITGEGINELKNYLFNQRSRL